ncbi:MAG: hypothetical protein M1825_004870 [Sarcosagium campestre]|nr:MAG: hypothetical protein M1825_004870 [Sarcosagium campestre]
MSPRNPSARTDFRDRHRFDAVTNEPRNSTTSPSTSIGTNFDDTASRPRTGLTGWGSRHCEDRAPFDVWEADKGEFRQPSFTEKMWIVNKYNATRVTFMAPMFFVWTAVPPNPMPLTLGGAGCQFLLPHEEDYHPLDKITDYSNPRLPDPISWKLEAWTRPTRRQLNEILTAVSSLADLKSVTLLHPTLCFELETNGRIYGRHSLPGRVAGAPAVYRHYEDPLWAFDNPNGRVRAINSIAVGTPRDDDTNYLASRGTICSGVRLESSTITNHPRHASATRTTTAGVLLRNTDGSVRMTASNHGFSHSNKVYHPTNKDTKIGEIDERFEALDVALVKLDRSVRFDIRDYFEAEVPKSILRGNEPGKGCWCSVAGMSTGIAFLQYRGTTVLPPPKPPGIKLDFHEWKEATILYRYGPANRIFVNEVCGAPIVEEGTGGVVGFFHLTNGNLVFAAVLDDLIDRDWMLDRQELGATRS